MAVGFFTIISVVSQRWLMETSTTVNVKTNDIVISYLANRTQRRSLLTEYINMKINVAINIFCKSRISKA